MTAQEIELAFVEFFTRQGFNLLPRASLLDPSIPMSFVMSAGLVQVEKSLVKLKDKSGNYTLVQDCFRHFVVEKVGLDSTHLSFFKMPGAFVFGKINHEKIIQSMWLMATDVLNLDPDKLWASYFKGDVVLGRDLPVDNYTHVAWKNAGLPEKHIVGLGREHNFWMQGNGFQGEQYLRKCGPHTELFFDRGEEISCGHNCLPGCACGRFIEFSNTLFIEFEVDIESNYFNEISNPFTETVIGVERVEMLQGNYSSVFETSTYKSIIDKIKGFVVKKDLLGEDVVIGQRIIADHLRALFYLVSDGALPPGKDGRQRIVKNLIRRVLTQQIILGIKSNDFILTVLRSIEIPLLEDRCPPSDTYEKIISYYNFERVRFFKTLQRGLKEIARLANQNVSSGLTPEQIYELRKYFGIPEIITKQIIQTDLLSTELFEVSNSLSAM